MRRLLLALTVLASVAGGLAHAATPVPAEPDTERRTRYTIVATSATLAVGFDIYGDSTDYSNWIEVYVDGVPLAQSGNWTLSSPSGSLSTLARPIIDAKVQLTNVTTGTVDIVGARRPRRTSQFQEGRGISARDFNQIFTDTWMTLRERWDRFASTVRTPPGDTISTLPSASLRANSILGFTSTGDVLMLSPNTGLGTVVGPASTTIGNVAAWNSTDGTILKDGGYPPIQTVGQTQHYFIQYINSSGVPVQVRPGCADLTNSAASCSTDATNASNIATGTLSSARLPAGLSTVIISGPTSNRTYTLPDADSTLTRTVTSGSQSLATTAISSATCGAAQTITASSVLSTDTVVATFNGDPTGITGFVPSTTGMLTIIFYAGPDKLNFKYCNNTAGTITPGSVSVNWRVTR